MNEIVDGLQILAPDALPILAELDSRDASVWLMPSFAEAAGPEATARVLGLPWEFVLSETASDDLLKTVDALDSAIESPLVRRRGLVHVIDVPPSNTVLPPRSLPIFLLNGRTGADKAGLAARARRMEMIMELQQRGVRNLVVLGGPDLTLPVELGQLWQDGFQCGLTIVSDDPEARQKITEWRADAGARRVTLLPAPAALLSEALHRRYTERADDRLIIRVRDAQGNRHRVDLSGRDDPEHPLLGNYELLSEAHLEYVTPEGLSSEEINGFFRDPSASWRPYAAQMPWSRDDRARNILTKALRDLDRNGPEASRMFYIRAESGAGATTFIRDLAFGAAMDGYPTLIATQAPFTPSGRGVANFITSCLNGIASAEIGKGLRQYEAPWLIVFDRSQWEGREGDIATFARQITEAGRRICIVFVTDALLPVAIYAEKRLENLCDLSHEISQDAAMDLGRHLNRFLRPLGTARDAHEWQAFFNHSLVGPAAGRSVFWIALAFWLQRQIDLAETVQGWLYEQFRQKVADPVVRRAIVDIAAMSTVRQLLPETLLPRSEDFPTRDKLSDLQSTVGALGVVRQRFDTVSHWAMIHDQLGRFLLTGLFYDAAARDSVGLTEAQNPDHLRLMVLARIASNPMIAHPDLVELAETFATSIFKIDPGQGRSEFALYWREALGALDAMPKAFRMTSRTFLHHGSISRRRIAKDDVMFPITDDERADLLRRATGDIEAALDLEYDPGGEPDLNLYNSLAHAYHDLAEVEARRGMPAEQVAALRAKANKATYSAYRLNPDNSYVLEVYARDRLIGANEDPDGAASVALEVLGIVYGAMQRETAELRRNALSRLADKAFELLLRSAGAVHDTEPSSEGEAIQQALSALGEGITGREGMSLDDFPRANRIDAAARLGHPLLRSNAQAVRLRYILACMDHPKDFALQLELLETLDGNRAILSPQLELELAILMHQRNRHHEASRRFGKLRQLWARGEHYVEVPDRLRWLIDESTGNRRQVRARIASGGDGARLHARVQELQNDRVPFRIAEFDGPQLRPGTSISGLISFGHNGPLLRPLTAG
ncbi:hypothetical protein [Pseudogemmobacter humi]|uniref:Inactive Sirtuin domain-containing protein n=1 Tax=Pseudogemmobacter humi TaxID=2483812 RepID=A0A3P5WC15_9RHOB|nr:hypothetical protein [Pseudogemmobacter humi]VDC19205.1 hypothetical protein XINFAN_00101 [Pseudogemmobacter humi]